MGRTFLTFLRNYHTHSHLSIHKEIEKKLHGVHNFSLFLIMNEIQVKWILGLNSVRDIHRDMVGFWVECGIS